METASARPEPGRLGLLEAGLVGLCVGAGVQLVELLTATREGMQYLDVIRASGNASSIWIHYAVVFGTTSVAAWLVMWIAGRGAAPRTATLLLALVCCGLPIAGGALYFHPAVRPFVTSFPVAPLAAALVLAALAFLAFAATRGTLRTRRLATGLGVTALLLPAAIVAGARQLNAAVLLRLDLRAWLSLWDIMLVAIALSAVLVLALRGIHQRSALRPLLLAWLVLQLGLLLALAGASPFRLRRNAHESAVAPAQGPSVLLIVMDTLRADFVAGTGAPPGATPELEKLVRDSVLFERAHSTAPWTLPSFGSILTSTYPSTHHAGEMDVQTNRRLPMSAAIPTLAETLRDAGYATGAVTTNGYLNPRYRLTRGFDAYENLIGILSYHPVYHGLLAYRGIVRPAYLNAETQTARVFRMIRRLEASSRPFFLLAHYMDTHLDTHLDTHAAYRVPEEFYDEATNEPRNVNYYAAVRYLDHWVGALLQKLRASGRYQDLLILVTADHGEELLEARPQPKSDRIWTHGHTLFEELLHVPLILKLPGNRLAGTRRTELVSGIDVAPTILGVLDRPVPATFAGVDVLAEGGDALRDRVVFSEGMMVGPELEAALRGDRKVIFGERAPDQRLALDYDLANDPEERHPLAQGSADGAFDALLQTLGARARTHPTAAREIPIELDAHHLEELKALGYVE